MKTKLNTLWLLLVLLNLQDYTAQAERPAKPGFSASSIALVLIFFVLANIGVILTLISDSNRRTSSRSSDLRTISNEFLINPTSINQ